MEAKPVVLVVDDVALNRLVLSRMLTKLGFDVLMAADGQQCLDICHSCHANIACVLLDLHMPVLDGWGTAVELRNWEAREPGRSLPLVACTNEDLHKRSNEGQTPEERALSCGIDECIAKPPKLEDLQAVLNKYLQADGLLSRSNSMSCASASSSAVGEGEEGVDETACASGVDSAGSGAPSECGEAYTYNNSMMATEDALVQVSSDMMQTDTACVTPHALGPQGLSLQGTPPQHAARSRATSGRPSLETMIGGAMPPSGRTSLDVITTCCSCACTTDGSSGARRNTPVWSSSTFRHAATAPLGHVHTQLQQQSVCQRLPPCSESGCTCTCGSASGMTAPLVLAGAIPVPRSLAALQADPTFIEDFTRRLQQISRWSSNPKYSSPAPARQRASCDLPVQPPSIRTSRPIQRCHSRPLGDVTPDCLTPPRPLLRPLSPQPQSQRAAWPAPAPLASSKPSSSLRPSMEEPRSRSSLEVDRRTSRRRRQSDFGELMWLDCVLGLPPTPAIVAAAVAPVLSPGPARTCHGNSAAEQPMLTSFVAPVLHARPSSH